MMICRAAFLSLFLLLVNTAAFANGAETFETSFSCSKATMPVEKAVCYNASLAKLDIQLGKVFKETAWINKNTKTSIRQSQIDWLSAMHRACALSKAETPLELTSSTLSCITDKYKSRIAYLKGLVLEEPKLQKVLVQADKAVSEACFDFDYSLSDSQGLPLRSYIDVKPARDYSVRIKKGQMCLSGLPHSSSTQITLKKGLKTKSGKVFGHDVRHNVKIGSRPKHITLNANNYILPKSSDPFLPIKTLNYKEVGLKFYRVDERNFISILPDRILGKQLSKWDGMLIRNDRGAEIWSGKLEIKNIPDQEVVTQIPVKKIVEKFKPGVYALVAKPDVPKKDEDNKRPTQWVVVTDLGLSVYKGEKGLSLQVRSLKTAKPVRKAVVKLVAKNNMVLAEAKTTATGWADFSGALLNGDTGNKPLYLSVQTKDGDFSFISLAESPLDLSDHGVSGKNPPGPLQAYMYADRGIYRPGEHIKLGYLLRNDLSFAQSNVPLTIVLYRPDGKEAFKTVQSPDESGGGRVNIAISSAAATGKWRLATYSDPKSSPIGELNIQVEEFVPERLEVSAHTKLPYLTYGQATALDVQADYLFGAPGGNLRVSGRARLNVTRSPFKGFDGFFFGLHEDKVNALKKLTEVRSDASGHAVLDVPAFGNVDVSSPLTVQVNVEVADSDGRPSRAFISLPLKKQKAHVGIKPTFTGSSLEFGQNATFEAIVLDSDGQPVKGHELLVDWVREDRSYNWFYQNGEWKSTYEKYDIPAYSETLKTDEKGKIAFQHSFDHWGYFRATVRDSQTGAAADHTFRVGWWADGQSPDRPDELELSIEHKDVKPGHNIKGFVKAPFAGRLLVTIAQKNIIFRKELSLPKEGTEFSIPVQKEWGNGAYVLVTAFRPGLDKEQRGPVRAVGAQWVSFGNAQHILNVALDVPDEILPETKLAVPVKVIGPVLGKEKIKVNVFAVDEGVLRLTHFKSPRPDQDLLAQQRLQLSYHDVYGHIISPQKGQNGTLRTGGDTTNMSNRGSLKTKVFKTVALASQTLDVDADGMAMAHFHVPDFNGKLRFFAVAYSATATGGGEANMLVRTPVIADLLPSRFLAVGDAANFAFRFQNLNGENGTYKVTLRASEHLDVKNPVWSGESEVGQKSEARFNVVAKKLGKAKLTLDIDGPDNYHQERHWDIAVRPAQPWLTLNKLRELSPSETFNINGNILDSYVSGTAHLNLTFSAMPELDVPKLVTELDRYPYGCLEQTTSRAFPLLAFSNVKDIWQGVDYDEASLPQKIREGIVRILEKQRSDGAFGLWSSHSHPEPWVGAYAMDFLTAARHKGYDVLDDRFNSALNWMERTVKSGRYTADARAYMLYVLAKNDRFTTSALKYEADRLQKKQLSSLGRAQVLSALVMRGIEAKPMTIYALTSRIRTKHYAYFTYGSPLRDFSAILTLPKAVFASDQDRLTLLTSVVDLAKDQTYTSTQEKAWMLQAAAKIAEKSEAKGIKIKMNRVNIDRDHTYRALLTSDQLGRSYTIENRNDGSVFVTYSLTGIPSEALKAEANGLSISRTYLDMSGTPIKLDAVKTGDKFAVVLEGHGQRNLAHKALVVDLLPAGFEIESNAVNNDLLMQLGMKPRSVSSTDFRAERDDRFVAAVSLGRNVGGWYRSDNSEKFKLVYVVRAVTPGNYVHPAPLVEDMYKPAYFARGDMSRLVVKAAE